MRCIVHVDLDCYYAQVEAIRLGIDCEHEAYVLVQWGNLLAVSYPARKFGISRFNSLREALQLCPHLKHSNVPTFRVGDSHYDYYPNPPKDTHKVSLEPYRLASIKIFEILTSFPDIAVEKAGIDEAFLDVTDAAAKELETIRADLSSSSDPSLGAEECEHDLLGRCGTFLAAQLELPEFHTNILRPPPLVISDDSAAPTVEDNAGGVDSCEGFPQKTHHPNTPTTLAEWSRWYAQLDEGPHARLLLMAGCLVARRVRDAVRAQLRFNCSAGISFNKQMAKCVSAAFKPNQQTLLLPSDVLGFLADFGFQKLRGFGGKAGDRLMRAVTSHLTHRGVPFDQLEAEAKKCSGAWLLSRADIGRALQIDAADSEGVFCRLHGLGGDGLTERAIPKSLMAQKVFSATQDVSVIIAWVRCLAGELAARYADFVVQFHQTARNVSLRLGSGGLSSIGDLGVRTCALPPPPVDANQLTAITLEALRDMLNTLQTTTPSAVAGPPSVLPSKINQEQHSDVNRNALLSESAAEAASSSSGAMGLPVGSFVTSVTMTIGHFTDDSAVSATTRQRGSSGRAKTAKASASATNGGPTVLALFAQQTKKAAEERHQRGEDYEKNRSGCFFVGGTSLGSDEDDDDVEFISVQGAKTEGKPQRSFKEAIVIGSQPETEPVASRDKTQNAHRLEGVKMKAKRARDEPSHTTTTSGASILNLFSAHDKRRQQETIGRVKGVGEGSKTPAADEMIVEVLALSSDDSDAESTILL